MIYSPNRKLRSICVDEETDAILKKMVKEKVKISPSLCRLIKKYGKREMDRVAVLRSMKRYEKGE